MTFLLALALWLFRMTGFLTEPMLTSDEIHAVTGEPSRAVWTLAPDRELRIVTWNIERGVKFEAIRSVLEELDADVVLLQEVDRFCSRSDDRDVARELALQLRMNYVTAGEFQEVGEGRRNLPCVSGQAILSRLPIGDATTVRFEDQASLKWRLNPVQPRRGGRIALRARIAGALFYSVHLESGGDEDRRANQVGDILANVPSGDEPVIIGGDFNNAGDASSAMFKGLGTAGFTNAMSGNSIERTVARRPIDWIFTKRITATSVVIRAADASDHDPVIAQTVLQRRF
jgi:endonuclease/exonuclease/phosphatase family metal-dependent hydrolase